VVADSRNPGLLPEAALDAQYVKFLATLENVIKAGQAKQVFKNTFRPALVASLLVSSLHGLLALNAIGHRGFRVNDNEMRRLANHLAARLKVGE
jgi:hypothetical protein